MSRKLTLGFCGIADFRSSIGQSFLNGVHDGVRDAGVNFINFCGAIKYSVSNDYELYKSYPSVFKYMNAGNIDGLVTWASSFTSFLSEDRIREIHETLKPLPMVAIGLPLLPDVPGVYTDTRESISLVMDHLVLERKCRRVAFLGSVDRSHYMDRYEAYTDWLRDHGMAVDPSLVFLAKTSDPEHLMASMQELTRMNQEGTRPDAIMTISDIAARQLIDLLAEQGLQVPRDIAVVGFNNQFESISTRVPITTIDPLFHDKGYRAVMKLVERLQNGVSSGVDREMLPPRLLVRQSTGMFEDTIELALTAAPASLPEVSPEETQEPLEMRIITRLTDMTPGLGSAVIEHLGRAVSAYMKDSGNRLLLDTIREAYTVSPSHPDRTVNLWQNAISAMRQVVLTQSGLNVDLSRKLEDLFHQARVLISVFNSYYLRSMQYDAYAFNQIAQIAIDLSMVTDGQQTVNLLARQIENLGIPSLILVLQDMMYGESSGGRIAMEYPKRERYAGNSESEVEVRAGMLPVRRLVVRSHNTFNYVMKLLYHKDQYIGYIMLESGPRNIAVYDMLCALLSHALYRNYVNQNRMLKAGETKALLRTTAIRNILQESSTISQSPGALSAERIIEYLADHVYEKTNVEKIARDLGQSTSSLMKKTRLLTGQTLQVLHELLKMERAKVLLSRNELPVSEIAETLGYSNQSYFAKIFRKHTALSPRLWTRRKSQT